MGATGKDGGVVNAPEKRLILAVDDDKLMRGILAEIIQNCGYRVETASNGIEALDRLRERSFDLVITDLIMPEMSGLDLIRNAKRLEPDLDLIVITASSSVDIAVETMKAGATDYIVKPFHLEQIRIVLARALEMRRLRDQARKADFYKDLSERDGLTGLLNYRAFQDLLRTELHRAARYERNVSLLMIDVDHFKDLNDAFGHTTGDRVLQQLARLLDESCRDPDHRCRYGGEEFAVIAPETDRTGAMRLAERIRHAIEETKFVHVESTNEGHVSVSIGVATCPEDGRTPSQLVEAADRALYCAKRSGRNLVVAAGAVDASGGPVPGESAAAER
jgi:two-component system, cell cycle response regulator